MRIIRDTPIELAYLAGRWRFPQHSLTLIAKGTFDLEPGKKARAAAEQELPTGDEHYPGDIDRVGSIRYESDFATFKPRADLMLVGHCHPPGGKAKVCEVVFGVGRRRRKLVVFGDRVWKKAPGGALLPSTPRPFTRIELRYENSFGGAEDERNPTGRGANRKVKRLPNIEDPSQLLTRRAMRPEPAGFGPLRRTWQQRRAKVGTYGGAYATERWPWFPEDFDWTHFNAAPAGLQMSGYLRGNEALYFENIHLEHRQYRTRLPGLRPRCFVRSSIEDPHLREVAMNLDTLWVDMDAERLVLVWRGITPVQSEEHEELSHAFLTTEELGDEPAPIADHEARFAACLAEQEAELEPELEMPPDTAAPSPMSPDIAPEPADPDAPDAPEEEPVAAPDIEEVDPSAAAEVEQALLAAGIDPAEAASLASEAVAEPRPEDGVPATEVESPPPLAAWTRERVVAAIAEGRSLAGADLSGLDLSRLDLTGASLPTTILTGASLQESDLSEADLRGAVLADVNLTRGRLRSARLEEADLTGCILNGADLTGARLGDAVLEGAELEGAILAGADARHADFGRAHLVDAVLAGADLRSADFTAARLTRADLTLANLREATIEDVDGEEVDMSGADLTELRAGEGCRLAGGHFAEVVATESIWEAADLSGADFSSSQLAGADFSGANLDAAELSGADCSGARFARTSLRGAKLVSTNLFEGSLEKADLSHADLSGSNLYGAELLDAVIDNTRLTGANLARTKLAGSAHE